MKKYFLLLLLVVSFVFASCEREGVFTCYVYIFANDTTSYAILLHESEKISSAVNNLNGDFKLLKTARNVNSSALKDWYIEVGRPAGNNQDTIWVITDFSRAYKEQNVFDIYKKRQEGVVMNYSEWFKGVEAVPLLPGGKPIKVEIKEFKTSY